MSSVVICELCQRDEVHPIVLLVIDVDSEVLLEDLVDTLHLTIRLWVVGRREVGLDS